MGQPHCRTCPFVDTRNPDSQQYRAASQEGLCRAEPHDWRKVKLDYDWCGRHPEINPEVLTPERIPSLPDGFYCAFLHVCLVWSRTMIRGEIEDQERGWKIEVYPDKDSYEVTYDLNSALVEMVRLGQYYYHHALEELKAKDPATPESDGA